MCGTAHAAETQRFLASRAVAQASRLSQVFAVAGYTLLYSANEKSDLGDCEAAAIQASPALHLHVHSGQAASKRLTLLCGKRCPLLLRLDHQA